MDSWPSFAASIFLICVIIAMPILVWREGLKSDYFFSWHLGKYTLLFPATFLFMTGLENWIRGEPLFTLSEFLAVPIVFAGITVFYTFGFLHGMHRRRKNEGIITGSY